jgi:acetyl-CoA synthetase
MRNMSEEKKIGSVLGEKRMFDPVKLNPDYCKTGMSMEEYKKIYERSIKDMEGFWAEQAKSIDFFKPYTKVWEKTDLFPGNWFVGGKINVAYNCVDRHVKAGKGDKVAIIWEADEPNNVRKFTYSQLLKEVSLCANGMKKLGLKKGDSHYLAPYDSILSNYNAGLCSTWSHPFHCLWWIFKRSS